MRNRSLLDRGGARVYNVDEINRTAPSGNGGGERMFDPVKFGGMIARLRKRADMTQSELGDRLGVTRQAVSKYEVGGSIT